MNNRIIIKKDKEGLTIVIKALLEAKKQQILILWIFLWSFCGVAIFSQFFLDYDNPTKIFFGVYIAFWMFFEFKVVYAYRWRKHGIEKISIQNQELTLTKEIGKRGITQKFEFSEIEELRLFKNDGNRFFKEMNNSYWTVNKYSLAFDAEKLLVPFAIDLSEKEAKMVLKELKEALR